MSKFKIGDIVIISGNTNGHGFPMNEKVRVIKLIKDYTHCEYLDKSNWWVVEDIDIEYEHSGSFHSKKPYWGRNPLVRSKDGKIVIRVTDNIGDRGLDYFTGVIVEDLLGLYPKGEFSNRWYKKSFILESNK